MLFNIDKISDKFDALTDFIPLFKFDSKTLNGIEHTMYINKNMINGFSHFKKEDKECLLVNFNINKNNLFKEYIICKEDNPVAFNELFKGLPEKLPKYDKSTTQFNTSS
jgi:hypothetical protein